MMEFWMAYYSDASSCVLFEHEIEALRWAVNNGMRVCKVDVSEGAVDVALIERSK